MKRYLVVCILSISLALTACGASTPEEATTSDVDTVEVDTNLASKDSIDVPSNLIEDKEETNETKETEDVVDSTDESKENEVDMEAASSDSKVTDADADKDSPNLIVQDTVSSEDYDDTFENREAGMTKAYDDNAKIRALKFPTLSGTYHGNGNGPGANWRSDFDYANLNVGDTRDDLWALKYWDDLPDRLTTFTASNGVTIKVCTNLTAENAVAQYFPIIDGEGADLLPGSPYIIAVDEAMYARGESMSKALNSDLDFVMPVTSVKRTSIDVSDPNLASLKASMDASFSQAEGGYGNFEFMYYQSDAMYLREGSTNGTPIQIERIGDYWQVTMRVNPAKNLWSWLKNCLNFLTPDSAHVYQFIYDTAYGIDSAYNSDAIVANTWYSFGNSQVYIVDTTGMGQMIYRFK